MKLCILLHPVLEGSIFLVVVQFECRKIIFVMRNCLINYYLVKHYAELSFIQIQDGKLVLSSSQEDFI